MAAASDEASETDCPILPTDDGPPDIGGCFQDVAPSISSTDDSGMFRGVSQWV